MLSERSLWRTRNGQELPIASLSDKHLLNIRKLISKRKAKVAQRLREAKQNALLLESLDTLALISGFMGDDVVDCIQDDAAGLMNEGWRVAQLSDDEVLRTYFPSYQAVLAEIRRRDLDEAEDHPYISHLLQNWSPR